MRLSVRAHRLARGALLLALAACDAAAGVEVQPLPPANRPSPAARAGLPDVEGVWHFAGWELPTAAALQEAGASLVRPGDFQFQKQHLDSIAGSYTVDGVRFPVVGEVRRDQRIALVALASDDRSRYAAGEVRKDTLWVELTSFAAAEGWPVGTRAAWVRGTAAAPFMRLPGAPVAPVAGAVDTSAAPITTGEHATPAAPGASGATPPPAPRPAERPDTQTAPTPLGTPVAPPTSTPAPVPGAPRPQPRPAPDTQPARAPTTPPVERQPSAPPPVIERPRPVLPPDTIVAPPPPEPGAR